jgi:hypothetical protein
MVALWEESGLVRSDAEAYQLWSHLSSGEFYAVRLSGGRVIGACGLSSAIALANRHKCRDEEYDLALGSHLSSHRSEYAVVERW